MTPGQMSLVTSNAGLLERLGIEVTGFGTDAVAIHAFPSMLKDADVVAFMRDLLDHLAQQPAETSTEEVIHEILDMMACKAAVKAGDENEEEDIEEQRRTMHLLQAARPSRAPFLARFAFIHLPHPVAFIRRRRPNTIVPIVSPISVRTTKPHSETVGMAVPGSQVQSGRQCPGHNGSSCPSHCSSFSGSYTPLPHQG